MSQTTLLKPTAAELTIVSSRPSKAAASAPWKPYLELTRFSKPAGLLGVYFPYFVGLLYSANTSTLPATDLAALSAIFLLDSLLLRSFGCAWNDTIDQDLDRQVERCKKRPLARGALTTGPAVATTLLLAATRHALLHATLPARAERHALLTTALTFIYPFMKRLCDYPQLCLGLGVGWAVFLVDAAVVDGPAASATPAPARAAAVRALFASQALFNVTYDTVYAFQDLRDDLRAGVRSLAVRVRACARPFVLALAGAMAAALAVAAGLGGLLRGPFVVAAGVAAVAAGRMLLRLDFGDPRSCRAFFVRAQWAVSGVLVVGLAGELVLARWGV
ncbi:UbiA prenyltransferase family [Neofusicoccum parvum]|uniref:UbiA prenyltransferase family n=1 Tax=Neofusicoccum parvum TaxID=310453 RepID=A0ACB5SPK8_9PEZI|nr:UbiA prenyltransferase family [Neofusicoccum parvum]